MDLLLNILFFVITLYVLFKCIYYGIYEFKTFNNKIGGIAVIIFSIVVTVLANWVLFERGI